MTFEQARAFIKKVTSDKRLAMAEATAEGAAEALADLRLEARELLKDDKTSVLHPHTGKPVHRDDAHMSSFE